MQIQHTAIYPTYQSHYIACSGLVYWDDLERWDGRGRWEGGSGWETHVHPWLIHVNVWQNHNIVIQFSSVTQSCPTLCNPMNRSTPGLPVHHQLPEFTQTMSIESVMPSSHLILCRPLLLLPPIPPSIRVFSNEYIVISLQLK